MKLLIILICCTFSSGFDYEDDEGDEWVNEDDEWVNDDQRWDDYKNKHNKDYSEDEDEERRGYFIKNARLVDEHNSLEACGLRSYRLGLNHFSDMSGDEFEQYTKCMTLDYPEEEYVQFAIEIDYEEELPESIDWREHGIVTPTKNQEGCGACWAFSTLGALESHIAIKTGKLVALSEQNLIDCAEKGARGCHGGTLMAAFEYIIKNKGVNTEEDYPYEAEKGKCKFSKDDVVAACTGYITLRGSEKDVERIVATIGPVSTSLDADHDEFVHYKSGIYHNDNCDENAQNNHGVLIVGYGEEDGKEYWIIKNSWGPNWGIDGYMHIKRNAPFMCGITKTITYPIL